MALWAIACGDCGLDNAPSVQPSFHHRMHGEVTLNDKELAAWETEWRGGRERVKGRDGEPAGPGIG